MSVRNYPNTVLNRNTVQIESVTKKFLSNLTLRRERREKEKELAENQAPSRESKDLGFPTDYQQFNSMIGNPFAALSSSIAPMTWYQTEYHDIIQQFHKVLINKGRKIGATEGGERSIALNCFDRYVGHDIMYVAGTDISTSVEVLRRTEELFQDRSHEDGIYAFKDPHGNKWKYDELIRKVSFSGTRPTLEYHNDTRIMCYPASKQGRKSSFRGADDVIAIYFIECAHTGMSDDTPIVDGLEPNLANRDDGDLIYETTPNGKRGFYHSRVKKVQDYLKRALNMTKMPSRPAKQLTKKVFENTGWAYREWPSQIGVDAGVVSQKYLDFQKADPKVNYSQEYECAFTTTSRSAFQELTTENYLPQGQKSTDLSSLLG